MTEKEDIFISTLSKQYPDLYSNAIKKKYKVLVPHKNLIFDSMLNRNFYDNHIFSVCKYDPNSYVNLCGKTLVLDHQKFITSLGFKKVLEFKIKEEFMTDQGLSCIVIDNICDENKYNKQNTSTKDSTKNKNYPRYPSMKQYIENYNFRNYPECERAFETFELVTDLLRNNVIFMKGHEDEFSNIFDKNMKFIEEQFKISINDSKNNSPVDLIVDELVDSLVFNKLYDYIFGSLVKFYEEEEKLMINKIKEFPNRYEISSMQVDKAYKDCKFEKAIVLLKELTNKRCIFEKLVYYLYIIFIDINY